MSILEQYTQWLSEAMTDAQNMRHAAMNAHDIQGTKNSEKIDAESIQGAQFYLRQMGRRHSGDHIQRASEHARRVAPIKNPATDENISSHVNHFSNALDWPEMKTESEHWDKVRGGSDVKIQQAQQYAQQMLDQHGDDETVQKLCAPIMKLNPNSAEHQEQILDAAKQLEDYASEQIGHEPVDDKKPAAKKKPNK